MEVKWIGALLIMGGCGGFGYSMAAAHRREERLLRQLLNLLDCLESQLQYHLTPLPQLCRWAADRGTGLIRAVFQGLALELERQTAPDVAGCMSSALQRIPELPKSIRRICTQLGNTLGLFDLPGQLKGLEAVRHSCQAALTALEQGRDQRLRSYQTLALCAGAALTILFI